MLCCVLWILGAAAFKGITSSMCVASILFSYMKCVSKDRVKQRMRKCRITSRTVLCCEFVCLFVCYFCFNFLISDFLFLGAGVAILHM